MKNFFDKVTKAAIFKIDYLVVKWDTRFEEKGKHGKFDHLWNGPYRIVVYHGNNTFILQNLEGHDVVGGLVKGVSSNK